MKQQTWLSKKDIVIPKGTAFHTAPRKQVRQGEDHAECVIGLTPDSQGHFVCDVSDPKTKEWFMEVTEEPEKTFPSVTVEHIKSRISEILYTKLPTGKDMVCTITVDNGFTVQGIASCVCPENFDEEKGKEISYKKAFDKLWELEGYLLQEKLHHNSVAVMNRVQSIYEDGVSDTIHSILANLKAKIEDTENVKTTPVNKKFYDGMKQAYVVSHHNILAMLDDIPCKENDKELYDKVNNLNDEIDSLKKRNERIVAKNNRLFKLNSELNKQVKNYTLHLEYASHTIKCLQGRNLPDTAMWMEHNDNLTVLTVCVSDVGDTSITMAVIHIPTETELSQHFWINGVYDGNCIAVEPMKVPVSGRLREALNDYKKKNV